MQTSAKQLEENGMEVYVVPEEDLQEWNDAQNLYKKHLLKTQVNLEKNC